MRSTPYSTNHNPTLFIAGVSTLTFLTNAPPTSGSLVLSPAVGVALVDVFSFEASSWVDDSSDYPLAYSFYYVVVYSLIISESSAAPECLPSGQLELHMYSLMCY